MANQTDTLRKLKMLDKQRHTMPQSIAQRLLASDCASCVRFANATIQRYFCALQPDEPRVTKAQQYSVLAESRQHCALSQPTR